jgi:hypothetical protein
MRGVWVPAGGSHAPHCIDRLSADQHAELDPANWPVTDGRLRICASVVLLAAERVWRPLRSQPSSGCTRRPSATGSCATRPSGRGAHEPRERVPAAARRRKRRREIAELLQTLVDKHPHEGVHVACDNSSTPRTTKSRPSCGCASHRVHSRYVRRLADLPWHGLAVGLRVQLRRLVCDVPRCRRRIVCERLPATAAADARRTARLTRAVERIGLALGGEAGARLAVALGMATSADTLLRVLRATPDTSDTAAGGHPPGPGRRLAWRRGQTVRDDPRGPRAQPDRRPATGPGARHARRLTPSAPRDRVREP